MLKVRKLIIAKDSLPDAFRLVLTFRGLIGHSLLPIIIYPHYLILSNEVVRLTGETVIPDRWSKCNILTIIVQLPIFLAQRGKHFPTTTARTGMGAYAVFHAYIKQPRIKKIRDLLNINRTQLVNLPRHCSQYD